jgi:hypothetical protein
MDSLMRIRLTRKLANILNGVDVSQRRVGEVIDLLLREAQLLLAEGWAHLAPDNGTDNDSCRPTSSTGRSKTRRT